MEGPIHAGADEGVVVAALLHDALDDHPREISTAKLATDFSPRVARIVDECTDGDPSQPRDSRTWPERKAEYISHLPDASDDGRLVSLADKLYNARACVLDLLEGTNPWIGADVHAGQEAQLQYHEALSATFLLHPPSLGRALAKEFAATVPRMRMLATEG